MRQGESFASPGDTESVGFFELTAASVSKLETDTADAATFGEQGTGTNLGYPAFTEAMEGTTVSNALGQSWIDALNGAAGGKFGVGSALLTYDGGTDAEAVFGFSLDTVVKLTVVTDTTPVPLPAGLPLVLTAMGGLALMRGRRWR